MKKKQSKSLFHKIFGEDYNEDKICARRLFGAIGFIICSIALFIPYIKAEEFSIFLYVSSGLLGLTTIDKLNKKIGKKK